MRVTDMKTSLIVIGAAMAFFALLSSAPARSAQTFQIQSADIAAGQTIPPRFAFNGFGCTGQNLSPTADRNRLRHSRMGRPLPAGG
jgi:phosphatidylethanolamine-binding protein (PEBP) family uncharacterized protein